MVFRCTKIGFFCQSSFRQAGCTDFCSLAGMQTVENRDFCLLEGVQTVENRDSCLLEGVQTVENCDFCLLEGVQTIENYDFCSLAPVQTLKNWIFGPAAVWRANGEGQGCLPKKAGGVPAALQGFVGHAPRICRNGVGRQRKASTSSGVRGIFLPRRRAPSAVMR